jgi:MFS family permease
MYRKAMTPPKAANVPSTTGWSDLLSEGRLPRFALICLGVWLNAAESLVTATIMPSVGAEIGGYAYFGWATAGFLMGAILAGASAGRVSELVGLRRATTIAGLVLASGCLLSAVAPRIEIFLAGRLLQGIGSGWISGFAMVAITLLFPERHLARVFASISAVWGIATVLSPLVGGIFAQTGDWRVVFWLFGLQAVLFALAAPKLLAGAEAPRSGTGVPWPQLGVLGLGVTAIALADVSQSPIIALALVAAGPAIVAITLRIDAGAPVRLLPRGAGDLRTIGGAGYATLFALVASSMGLLVYGPAILQQLHGLSPLWAGYLVAAQALAWTLSSFTVVNASEAARLRWIRVGASCILASVLGLMLVLQRGGLDLILAVVSLMGVGFGVSVSLINRRIIGALHEDDRAVGGSALIAARQTGGAVGAAIAGATANLVGFGSGLSTASAEAAAIWVFATAIPIAGFGVWTAWRLTGSAAASPPSQASAAGTSSQPQHPLLQAVEGLTPRQQWQLVCALAMLWDEHQTDTSGSSAELYAHSMRLAAYRVRQNGRPDQQHYALAPELMALYAERSAKAARSSRNRQIAQAIEALAVRGGHRATPPSLGSSHSSGVGQ